MNLIQLQGERGSERVVLDGRGVALVAPEDWVEIYSIQTHGKRPPMIVDFDNVAMHFLTFGTGIVNPDTMISLYHVDQGPFPTRLIMPKKQNATLGLRATAGAPIDWTLEVEFWWARRPEPPRWVP